MVLSKNSQKKSVILNDLKILSLDFNIEILKKMIDSVTSALGGALHEVDLAVNGTFKSQTDLRERLENIQVVIRFFGYG